MSSARIAIRAAVFTILAPGVVTIVLPALIDPGARFRAGWWGAGWLLITGGALIYSGCLARFVTAGGTPAIFFARHLRFLIGEEPGRLVSTGPYRFSRNPMYVGVLCAVFGLAIAEASIGIAAYGFVLFVFFHVTVVLIEEPHLRAKGGADYELYLREAPRWFSLRSIRRPTAR